MSSNLEAEVSKKIVRNDLSSSQAERALYIDFEGTMTKPSSFLGIACEGKWEVVVIEESLWPAAEHGARGGSVQTARIEDVLAQIRERAEREDRCVVAWSTRELDEIETSLPDASPDLLWWKSNLINALPIAKRWARRHSMEIRAIPSTHGGRENRYSLSGFMEAVGFDVPRNLGTGNSAQRIRHVRGQLEQRGSFAALTPTAKGKWSRGLQHNRYDCLGLAAVMEAVSRPD